MKRHDPLHMIAKYDYTKDTFFYYVKTVEYDGSFESAQQRVQVSGRCIVSCVFVFFVSCILYRLSCVMYRAPWPRVPVWYVVFCVMKLMYCIGIYDYQAIRCEQAQAEKIVTLINFYWEIFFAKIDTQQQQQQQEASTSLQQQQQQQTQANLIASATAQNKTATLNVNVQAQPIQVGQGE